MITQGYGNNKIITQGYGGIITPFPLCITLSGNVEYGITLSGNVEYGITISNGECT